MRIVLIIQKPQARGAELFATNLAQGLEKRGHHVLLLSLFPGNFSLPFSGKQVHLNRNSSHRLWDWKGWRLIQQEIKDWDADLVLAMAGDTLKYMVMSKLLFGWKAKAIFYNGSMVSNYIHSLLVKKYNSFLFSKLDAVVSVSHASAQDLETLFPFPLTQYVIPVGIQKGGEKRRETSAIDLIHIGGFTFEKNHEGLLRIFSKIKLQFPSIRLVSFGTGPLDNEIKQKALEMGISDGIDWRGAVDRPFEKIENKAILLLPSLIEGYPAVIAEAFLSKIPVVAFDVGGVNELVVPEKTGWLVSKEDEDGFVEKVIEVLTSPSSKLQSILKEAERFAIQNCLMPETALKYEETFQEILFPKKKYSLKILQLITKKQRRGAEIFTAQLAEELSQLGHEVYLISVFPGEAELPFSGLTFCLNASPKQRFRDWHAWKKLSKLIEEIEPDLIQANASETLKYAAFSKKMFGWRQPLIYRNANQMSLFIRNRLQLAFNRWLMKEVSGIASVSQICKQDFERLFSEFEPAYLPIGIDPISIEKLIMEPIGSNLPENFLLFIGGLVPEKNPLSLIYAVKEIKNHLPDLTLVLVGTGPLEQELRSLIVHENLQNQIILLSSVSNIFPILSKAQALLVPSKIEGLPAVILEAMYAKIPVVAYGVGGIPEVLKTGETGWCISPGDQQEFLAAIQEVISLDSASKNQILENAHQLVTSTFTLNQVARQFEEFYLQILNKSI
jgi:L-malate glycosyltransferase